MLPVYLEITLTRLPGYTTDTAFATGLASALAGFFKVGDPVNPYDIIVASRGLFARVTGLNLGFTDPPAFPSVITSTVLQPGSRARAVADVSRINVISS